ncbi:hypothetical protein HanHA89_Chr15g0610811 [Helianthus annuus]|nr:hypothetical protein HanHA89_Chr15g0610811 [Helianthus annuus]
MGFFSFRQRDHTLKLMIPPKGMTKWKTKFFYVKAAAITVKLQFRNMTGTIITENISVPKADTVDWFPRLRIIGWVKLDNRQLWVLRMMLGRMSRKTRPVLREKNGEEAPLWRTFCPDFKGKVEIVACADGEEGLNRTIIDNFRLPDRAALEAMLPEGKGIVKPHETVFVPSLVPEVAGISRNRLRKYDDYVVVSDTLDGLGVTGGVAVAGGSSVGTKPIDNKKRKGDAPVAGGHKAPKLRKTRATAIPKPKPAVTTGKLIICYTSVVVPVLTDRCVLFCVEAREEPVSLFATPHSSPKVADVEVQKEGRRNPSIEVVSGGGTPPSVHVEETAGETIADTLDSSNNLIDPHDAEGQGGEKPKSPVAEKPSSSTAAGTGVDDQPSIQPGETELEFYYRSYAVERGLDYHRPPWNVMQMG